MKAFHKVVKVMPWFLCMNIIMATGMMLTYFGLFKTQSIVRNWLRINIPRNNQLFIYFFVIILVLIFMVLLAKKFVPIEAFDFVSPERHIMKSLIKKAVLDFLKFSILGGVILWCIMNVVLL